MREMPQKEKSKEGEDDVWEGRDSLNGPRILTNNLGRFQRILRPQKGQHLPKETQKRGRSLGLQNTWRE